MKSSRRIMYLRDEHFFPIGCVAISLSKNRSTVRYQVSVLNPVDQFERGLARHIALGRLLENPIRITGFDGQQDGFEVTMAVMESIECSNLPNRARKAARRWLNQNSVQ